jgi:hypothetical protein
MESCPQHFRAPLQLTLALRFLFGKPTTLRRKRHRWNLRVDGASLAEKLEYYQHAKSCFENHFILLQVSVVLIPVG